MLSPVSGIQLGVLEHTPADEGGCCISSLPPGLIINPGELRLCALNHRVSVQWLDSLGIDQNLVRAVQRNAKVVSRFCEWREIMWSKDKIGKKKKGTNLKIVSLFLCEPVCAFSLHSCSSSVTEWMSHLLALSTVASHLPPGGSVSRFMWWIMWVFFQYLRCSLTTFMWIVGETCQVSPCLPTHLKDNKDAPQQSQRVEFCWWPATCPRWPPLFGQLTHTLLPGCAPTIKSGKEG